MTPWTGPGALANVDVLLLKILLVECLLWGTVMAYLWKRK